MQSIDASLAADHIRDLLGAAEAERLAASARNDGRKGVAAPWRRSLGAGADRLSLTMWDLAVRLDPSLPRVRGSLRRYGAE